MDNVFDLNDHREKKRHLENQGAFDRKLTYSAADEVAKISQGFNRMSVGMTSFAGKAASASIVPASRYQIAAGVLSRWKSENNLNLKFRKDISRIEIDEHGLRLGRIYWEFAYMFMDTLEHGDKYLKKYKLNVPTLDDINDSAMLLPGYDMDEKRSNLMLLLGFRIDEGVHCKMWTSTKCETALNDDDEIGLGTDLGDIIDMFRNKMKRFLGTDDLFNLIYHDGTGICVYEASQYDVGNICGIRKIIE